LVWIVVPVHVIVVGYVGTDIVKGICVPYGVYASYALEKAMVSSIVVTAYLLPLTAMVFCYGRIVHALKFKVIFNMSR